MTIVDDLAEVIGTALCDYAQGKITYTETMRKIRDDGLRVFRDRTIVKTKCMQLAIASGYSGH